MTASAFQLVANQALAAFQRRDFGLAAKLCKQALAQNARHPGVNHLAGVVAFHGGDLPLAIRYLRKAVDVPSPPAGALADLGQVLVKSGRLDDAVRAYDRAVEQNPQDADAWDGLGNVLADCGRLERAIDAAERARALQKDNPRILANLGSHLARAGRHDPAVQVLDQVLRLVPDHADALSVRAGIENERGAGDVAEALARRALAVSPGHLVAVTALAAAMKARGEVRGAESMIRDALERHRGHPVLLLTLAGFLAEGEDATQACNVYRDVLRHWTQSPKALTGLASLLVRQGHFDEARDLLHRAIGIAPDWTAARMELALLELSLGRYDRIFPHWDWRWKAIGATAMRPFPQPLWDGVVRLGQKVLLWGEQGVGDEILSLSLLPSLLRQGLSVVIECDPRLVVLLQRTWPDVTVVGKSTPAAPETLECDVQLPLGSLVGCVSPANHAPWLRPDSVRVDALRRRLGAAGPVIGISWRSAKTGIGIHKSAGLEQWDAVFAHPGATFVSLQYGDVTADIAAVRDRGVSVVSAAELGIDVFDDLDGLAALVAAMDMIVSTSNSTVHFAGALGVTTHLLVPNWRGKLWYWGNAGETCPWYPSLRLYRQTLSGQWRDVLAGVAAVMGPQ